MTAHPHHNKKKTSNPHASQNSRQLKKRDARSSGEPRHWIIVADHKQAHIYQKTPKGIERVPEELLHCSLPLPHDEASEESFLRDLACWLDAARKENTFDRLAFIATPQALDALHGMVGKEVDSCICGAVPRDVAEITADEIEDHLADIVWV